MPLKIKIAAVFRSYAKSPDVVHEVITRALTSLTKASRIQGIDRVMFLVPTDHDCGDTIQALSDSVKPDHGNVSILGTTGHHSCGALNHALEVLWGMGYTHALFISNKAVDYLTEDAVALMREAFAEKENLGVIGMDIPELQGVQIVPIQNTFAMWDIAKLREVGGFDSELGVEEVAPTARLLNAHYGAAVIPAGAGALSVRGSSDGQARHHEVVSTKEQRQMAEAERVGVTASWIAMNVELIARQ